MMSEKKRFVQSKYVHHLLDTKTDIHYYLTSEKIGCNDLFDEIERLAEENEQLKEENKKLIEDWEFSFRTELAHHRFAEKELKEKIRKKQAKIKELEKENEDLREVNKENRLLHEENVKQCERWKNLYEIKDAEVTARVDALNKVCEYYTSEVLFKSDVDPNKAVKEVINEILNTEVEM